MINYCKTCTWIQDGFFFFLIEAPFEVTDDGRTTVDIFMARTVQRVFLRIDISSLLLQTLPQMMTNDEYLDLNIGGY